MKNRTFYVTAAKTGRDSQPWQIKIWLPAKLAKDLGIQSGDKLAVTRHYNRLIVRKVKPRALEST